MIASILAIFTTLKPLLTPLLTFIVGLLFPSPLQKTRDGQDKIHDAEKEAQDSKGYMDDLDKID